MKKKELRELTLKELEMELSFLEGQEVIVTLDSTVDMVKSYRSFNSVATGNKIVLSENDIQTEEEQTEGITFKEDNIYRFVIDRDNTFNTGYIDIDIVFKNGDTMQIETTGTVIEG